MSRVFLVCHNVSLIFHINNKSLYKYLSESLMVNKDIYRYLDKFNNKCYIPSITIAKSSPQLIPENTFVKWGTCCDGEENGDSKCERGEPTLEDSLKSFSLTDIFIYPKLSQKTNWHYTQQLLLHFTVWLFVLKV